MVHCTSTLLTLAAPEVYADGKFTNIRGVYVYFVALFSASQLVASGFSRDGVNTFGSPYICVTLPLAVYALINFERVFGETMPLQRQ